MSARPIAWLLGAVLALHAPTLRAQDVEPELMRAYELRERGDHEAARRVLSDAYARSRSPKALAMLALAEHALGRWVEAYDHLSEALTHEHPWIDRTRAELLRAMRDLESRVARLVVRGPEGTELSVDGVARGALPLDRALALEPGSHLVEATRPDGSAHTANRALRAGERWVESVPPGSSAARPPASAPSALPWVVFGATAAVAVAGAVMWGVGQADVSAIEGSPVGRAWPADDAERAVVLSNAGWISVAVGGAAMAVALVWALLDDAPAESALRPPGVIRF